MPSNRNLSEKSVALVLVLAGIVAAASFTLLLFQAGYAISSNVTGIDMTIQATQIALSDNQPSPSSLSSNNATTVGSNTLSIKLLADNLENRLNKSAAILEITSKLPEVRKGAQLIILCVVFPRILI